MHVCRCCKQIFHGVNGLWTGHTTLRVPTISFGASTPEETISETKLAVMPMIPIIATAERARTMRKVLLRGSAP